jgi:hypothetical protein
MFENPSKLARKGVSVPTRPPAMRKKAVESKSAAML